MNKIVKALEEYPNLANRALVFLLQDEKNSKKILEWIKKQTEYDIRFARLYEQIRTDDKSAEH